MTYYEELGVTGAASHEEIRRSYRRLVRLLHPDPCTDPATRTLAELQMRRLNGILEMLSAPAARAGYDLSLQRRDPPRACRPNPASVAKPPARHRRAARYKAAAAAAVAGALVLLLLCAAVPYSPPVLDPVTRTAAIPPPLPSQPSTTGAAPPPLRSSSTIAGEWVFLATSETRRSGYPPEYIELQLGEHQGVIHGRYRARHRLPGRAISRTVAFQFEGPAKPGSGVLPWRGPGGARGEISLRLLDPSHLAVDWASSEPGEELSFVSGAATLVRRLE